MGIEKDYYNALKALRPRGIIWEIKEGSVADREMMIEAQMFAKVHRKAEKLPQEANLATTVEMLEDWEDLFELPHEGSIEERQTALQIAANEVGDQSPGFYKDLAVKNGVEIEVVEHCPFMFGDSQCGGDHEIGPEEIIYFWEIVIKNGAGNMVERLKKLVIKRKQSHTVLTFIDKRGTNGKN